MQSLEQIIRPFQTPDVISKRKIVSKSTKLPTDEVVIEWGRSGDAPTPTEIEKDEEEGVINFKVNDCDDKYNEKNRKFSTVRIENPDDPSQYVMVQRIEQIKFNKKSEGTNLTMYNNSTTAFVPMPMFDNNSYFADDDDTKECHSSFTLKNN